MSSIQTTTVKMFANFQKNIFIPMTGEMATAKAIHAKLRGMGAAVGRHSVAALIEGKELIVRGFEVVTVADHHVGQAGVIAKRADVTALVTPHVPKSSYPAVGELIAVRRNSKIAIGLEALKKGCTEAELMKELGHGSSETVHSFLMYRPKKRGYGLNKGDDGKLHLVMPEGVTDILYTK